MERISSVIALALLTAMNCIAQPFTQSELGWPLVSGTSAINEPPTATNKIMVMLQGSTITNQVHGHDETSGWTYSIDVNPTNGTIDSFTAASGNFTYTPTTNGSDFFTFIVHEIDGSLTATGRVSVNIVCTNCPNRGFITNCFPVYNSLYDYCIQPCFVSTVCVSHNPSQSGDGCITTSSGNCGGLDCSLVDVGDAASVCIAVSNIYTATICTACQSGIGTTSTNAVYNSTNSGFVTSNNTFQIQSSGDVDFSLCNSNSSSRYYWSTGTMVFNAGSVPGIIQANIILNGTKFWQTSKTANAFSTTTFKVGVPSLTNLVANKNIVPSCSVSNFVISFSITSTGTGSSLTKMTNYFPAQ